MKSRREGRSGNRRPFGVGGEPPLCTGRERSLRTGRERSLRTGRERRRAEYQGRAAKGMPEPERNGRSRGGKGQRGAMRSAGRALVRVH